LTKFFKVGLHLSPAARGFCFCEFILRTRSRPMAMNRALWRGDSPYITLNSW